FDRFWRRVVKWKDKQIGRRSSGPKSDCIGEGKIVAARRGGPAKGEGNRERQGGVTRPADVENPPVEVSFAGRRVHRHNRYGRSGEDVEDGRGTNSPPYSVRHAHGV